jgi:MMPL family protein
VLAWIAIVAILNTTVPQLEEVGKLRAVSMSPNDAPALIATKRVGQVFQEYNTSSSVMIVLEGDDPLGADAHASYDEMVRKLRGRHETRPARPGLLGRYVDRGRRSKHRRQGRLRAGVHRRRPRIRTSSAMRA